MQLQENFKYNDGGRALAGFKGSCGDCVVRAISIVTEIPYQQVYDDLNKIIKSSHNTKQARQSSSRNGVHRKFYEQYLKSLGWEWVPVSGIGTGCKMHLKKSELPKGRIIARLSQHLVAVIDGVIHDCTDPSRNGTRCVYGYYKKGGV